jgi:rubrerythrin
MSVHEETRRDAMRRGLIAGGALVSAAVAPAVFRAGTAFGQADTATLSGDAGILEGVIEIEQTAVVAYESIASRGLFGARSTVPQLLVEQEKEHVAALIAAFKALGGTPPPPPRPTDIPGFTELSNVPPGGADPLTFAILLENQILAHYIDGVKELEDPNLMKLFAQTVPDEGQHLVLLRQSTAGSDPMPVPLPTGEEKN